MIDWEGIMATQTTTKHSKQREAILAFLRTRKDHPTADTVYQEIRTVIPNISLGTVYRNLSLLSDKGEILRLSCDGKVDRFDADTRPHYHFMCQRCGCVQDVYLAYDASIDTKANETFSGTITGHQILFEGLCAACTEPI